MRGQTPNRRFIDPTGNQPINLQISNGQPPTQAVVNLQSQQGYTEFFSWGNDEDGQLGHGQEDPNRKKVFNLPKSLSFEVLIAQVSCGQAHTAFISKQGYVFAFGSNSDGQLGVNDQAIKYSTAPLLVSDLISLQATPKQISCGGYHTAVLSTIGEVYLWGRNIQGQCGRPISYNQFLFTPNKLHTDQVMKQFSFVDCGDLHTALISTTGELFTFGDNSDGQLGISVEFKNTVDRASLVTGISERVIQVSCGYRHTLALTDNGMIFGMGSNRRYELGLGQIIKSVSPVRIQSLEMYQVTKVVAGGFSVALTSTDEVLVWGSGEFGQFQTPQKIYMDDIRFVDLSLSKSLDSFGAAVDIDGFVYGWGQNQFGQLGLGDFRSRKLPTKVPQLRKKKVRQIACGGNFIAALGKDVSDSSKSKKQSKRDKEKQHSSNHEISEGHQSSYRSKSQVAFTSNLQHSSLRRKRNDGDKSQHQTLQAEILQKSQERTASRYNNQSQEGNRSMLTHSYNYYNGDLSSNTKPMHTQELELSAEKRQRALLERELKDKEYEIQTIKNQSTVAQDLQIQVSQYKRDNEVLRDALQKEQENSYKILGDFHKSLAEQQALKEQIEDKSREVRSMHLENKRHCERIREVEVENDRLKQESIIIVQRSDQEVTKLKQYIGELEKALQEQRSQASMLQKYSLDQQRVLDSTYQSIKTENADLKRQVYNQNEKCKNLEYLSEQMKKENDDLKYDNTLLYDKNVEKDKKIQDLNDEIDKFSQMLNNQQQLVAQKSDESRFLTRKLQDQETALALELEKLRQKELQLADLQQLQNQLKREFDDNVAQRSQQIDNLKRSLDEQSYECENLRRTIASKQDEIGQLNRIIQQSSQNNAQLVDTIRGLEDTIKDVEEKNKKLNDLLNATIYNRAEKYKEKVINKLQERTPNVNPMITPNKTSGQFQLNESQISSDTRYHQLGQPSPIRLQKILSDEKEQQQKERERLLKIAESMTKSHDLSKSVGLPQQNNLYEDQSFKRLPQQSVSPFSNQNNISPTRANTTAQSYFNTGNQFRRNMLQNELQAQFSDQQQMPNQHHTSQNQQNARLRLSDLHNQYSDYVNKSPINIDSQYQQQQQQQHSSPERIADILRQQSPFRKKLATDALSGNASRAYSPDKSPYIERKSIYEDDQNQGNLTASKITHVIIFSQFTYFKFRNLQIQNSKIQKLN